MAAGWQSLRLLKCMLPAILISQALFGSPSHSLALVRVQEDGGVERWEEEEQKLHAAIIAAQQQVSGTTG